MNSSLEKLTAHASVHRAKTGDIDDGMAKFINVDLLEDVPTGN